MKKKYQSAVIRLNKKIVISFNKECYQSEKHRNIVVKNVICEFVSSLLRQTRKGRFFRPKNLRGFVFGTRAFFCMVTILFIAGFITAFFCTNYAL